MATTVSRLDSAGNLFINGSVDEVSYNPTTLSSNLYQYSEDFTQTSYWYQFRGTFIPNYAIAPNGTKTATLVTSTGDYTYLSVNPGGGTSAFNVSPGEYWTASVYVKYVSNQYCSIVNEVSGGVSSVAVFDLINGTINNQAYNCSSCSITSVGNNWWRVVSTTLVPAGSSGWNPHIIWLGQYTGGQTGTAALYWGAQIQKGNAATFYTKTTTGNLVNLATYSQDGTQWGTSSYATIISTTELAPDGTYTAVRVRPTAQYGGVRTANSAWLKNIALTGSAWVKVDSGTQAMQFGLNGGGLSVNFTATSSWTRFSTGPYTNSVAYDDWFYVFNFNTSGFVDFIVWGFQVEKGSTLSPYQGIRSSYTIISGLTNKQQYQLTSTGTVNMLSYSNSFDNTGYWSNYNVTSTPASIADPLTGLNTGYLLTENTATNTHNLQAYPTFTSGNRYTLSVYAKSYSGDRYLFLLFGAGSIPSQQDASFDLVAGTVYNVNTVNGSTASITSAGNGWYRCSLTTPAATSTGGSTVWIACRQTVTLGGAVNYTGNGTSGIYIADAQVEIGTETTTYVSMPLVSNYAGQYFTSNAIDEVSYNPDGGFNGYIAYTSGSLNPNLESYSQDYSQTYWGKNSITLLNNTTPAPDGTLTATKLQETAVTAFFGVTANPTAQFNTTYTMSVYAKAAERNVIGFNFSGMTGGTTIIEWNLSTQTTLGVGTIYSSNSIISVGNGWYRCSATFTTPGSGSNLLYHLIAFNAGTGDTYTGTTGSGIYIWGAQLQTGIQATGYVSTTGSGPIASGSTNLFHDTNNITNSTWSDYSLTATISITADTTAPDGTLTAYKFIALSGVDPNSNSSQILSQQNGYGQVTQGSVYTQSIFFKAAEFNTLRIRNNSSGEIYDFITNIIPTATSGVLAPQLRNVGNGWYRASWSFVAGNIGGGGRADNWSLRLASTGDGTSGIYIWGPQLQAGYTLSPYIAIGSTLYAAINNFKLRTVPTGPLLTTGSLDEVTWNPPITTTGLVLNLDAAIPASYNGGTTWIDLSGNNANGTLTSGTTYSYTYNGIISFNGTSYILTTQNTLPISYTNNFSCEAWIFVPSSYTWNATNKVGVFHRGSYGGFCGLCLYQTTNNRVYFGLRGTTGGSNGPSGFITRDTWWHLVGTWTASTNTASLYLNGSLAQAVTFSQVDAPAGSWQIGYNTVESAPGNYFTGNIAGTRLYNKSLSSTEVAQNYNATKARYGR